MRRGDFAVVVCSMLFTLVIAIVAFLSVGDYEAESAPKFAHKPKDRPVIESMPKVWEARATGVCDFYFDGEHYVVEDLPKEYVDYAAWYVRLP